MTIENYSFFLNIIIIISFHILMTNNLVNKLKFVRRRILCALQITSISFHRSIAFDRESIRNN